MRRPWLEIALATALDLDAARLEASPPSPEAVQSTPAHGQILRRAMRADPSQEYLLYLPIRGGPGAPVLVTVHGISRNVEEHAALLAPLAEQQGVVLVAPLFTRERNAGYQRLRGDGATPRADRVLNAILMEVTALTGAESGRIYLFGYSGGAQFAHRYTLAHPEKVIRAVIGAAGWYTFPDDRAPYPYGLGPSAERPAMRFDPERFLRVPITVLVGEEDTEGGESLRRNDLVDRQQGTTRRERARRWVSAMNRAARERALEPPAAYEEVAGIEHSFRQFMHEGGLGDRVFAALFGTERATGSNP